MATIGRDDDRGTYSDLPLVSIGLAIALVLVVLFDLSLAAVLLVSMR